MTDISRELGRIDLRAIDEPADPGQGDRVIAAAMSRIAADRDSRGPRRDAMTTIVIYAQPLLAAAAALVVIAAGTLIKTSRPTQQDQPASVLASWAESNHVPTNGELLAVFQGYDQ